MSSGGATGSASSKKKSYGLAPWIKINGTPHALLQVSFAAGKLDAKFDPLRGKQDAFDEGAWECATREAFEESGRCIDLRSAPEPPLRDSIFSVKLVFEGPPGAAKEQVKKLIELRGKKQGEIDECQVKDYKETEGLGFVDCSCDTASLFRHAWQVEESVKPMSTEFENMAEIPVKFDEDRECFVYANRTAGGSPEAGASPEEEDYCSEFSFEAEELPLCSVSPEVLAVGSERYWRFAALKAYRYPGDELNPPMRNGRRTDRISIKLWKACKRRGIRYDQGETCAFF